MDLMKWRVDNVINDDKDRKKKVFTDKILIFSMQIMSKTGVSYGF